MSDFTIGASESGAALLERASAPSRPEQGAIRALRAGVASRVRVVGRAAALARAEIPGARP